MRRFAPVHSRNRCEPHAQWGSAVSAILCVDDEPTVGVVLEHALAEIGHSPVLAGSVDDAMRAVAGQPFDLIISDYRLRNDTGLDLLRLLREQGHAIPVIIM